MSRNRLTGITHWLLIVAILISFVGFVVEKSRRETVNERMDLAMESARAGWWIWEVKEDKLFWSDGMFELYDEDREDWNPTYQGFADHLHPDDREEVEKLVNDCINYGIPFRVGFRIVLSSGDIREIFTSGQRSDDGKYLAGINLWDSIVRVYK